ncbi:MAG: SAM-dependent DNA methyltransferase [Bacteroidales bacterium]|nr:SAM-dependent DNA methyltransferase [Bacteroidales bacterium]MBR4240066.1 SAM-dependent DNA methyltransferase [Prevotella sp.]MBR4700023.1 SAM-dependent DNA methyltransferase [Prevotella sp.]
MKNEKQQAAAAAAFAERWKGRGYERGESQLFWADLLSNVYGVEDLPSFIRYEEQVSSMVDSTNFIDGHIPSTRVLIEQKSINKDLRKGIPQSDGSVLNPFQQAKKYVANMPLSQHPRWIVTCNFSEFLVYDMEQPNGEPEQILLENLGKEYYRLQFLVDLKSEHISKEMQVSMKAGEIVGRIYDALLKQYDDNSPEALRWLNILCVRIVFCLYAEDAGVFRHDQFHDFLSRYDADDIRRALSDLFEVLNTPLEKRSKYLKEDLKAFPYTNGGLFEEAIEIPQFTEELKQTLLQNASLDFDWSEISPTIFGAVFESTLNPETRRSGGMHYTSIENIHKVIDPLFLNDLRSELDGILEEKVEKTRLRRLDEYQDKLASLTFLDPACGSGNFLTETYLSLRRLENEAIRERYHGQYQIGAFLDPIKVSIHQFYGIEINDFAVTVATTALWISEAQMLTKTEQIVQHDIDFLPLKSYANIKEGNALRVDWNDVVPAEKLDYIMGNPPFVGFTFMTAEQKEDVEVLYPGIKNIDYVSCWFKKACEYTRGTDVECAFVSTNSITQGETVGRMWESLDVQINFAWPTFRWDSEASEKAHVHCVIIGFSHNERKHKYLYNDGGPVECHNINAYLVDAPSMIVSSRNKPLCNVPAMIYGNKPADGGCLIFTKEEKDEFLKREPKARRWMHTLIGGAELINNKPLLNDKLRYTLWLDGISPDELRRMPAVLERIAACKEARLKSPAAAIRKFAETPHLYAQRTQPNIPKLDEYGVPLYEDGVKHFNLLVPEVSSERRRYVPMGYIANEVVTNNLVKLIPDASIYHFGILVSNVHMAWMRAVCGRLKSDYRYSKDVVYNNFPWPSITDAQKERIEKTAQAILDARSLYPKASLADLYDELTMPMELRRAHQENDRAVMAAYGFDLKMTESQCVAELFKLYQGMVK